jgi:hypothetical protein
VGADMGPTILEMDYCLRDRACNGCDNGLVPPNLFMRRFPVARRAQAKRF